MNSKDIVLQYCQDAAAVSVEHGVAIVGRLESTGLLGDKILTGVPFAYGVSEYAAWADAAKRLKDRG